MLGKVLSYNGQWLLMIMMISKLQNNILTQPLWQQQHEALSNTVRGCCCTGHIKISCIKSWRHYLTRNPLHEN